jgi:hypothetical protein
MTGLIPYWNVLSKRFLGHNVLLVAGFYFSRLAWWASRHTEVF